jgi:hypothetical protein
VEDLSMKRYAAVAIAVLSALSVAGCIGKGKAPPPVPVAPAAVVTRG